MTGHKNWCDMFINKSARGHIPIDLSKINPDGFRMRRALEGSLEEFCKEHKRLFPKKTKKPSLKRVIKITDESIALVFAPSSETNNL